MRLLRGEFVTRDGEVTPGYLELEDGEPEHPEWFYLSCPAFTVAVRTASGGKVVKCPPIVRKFKGQHVVKLASWMEGRWPNQCRFLAMG